MEFNEKLQQLRKQKGLTQEELAQMLYVSRTAISKWESGKGYPNIDSLKQLSNLFGISVDYLLSGDQLLTVAKEDSRQKESQLRDIVFSLLDLSTALLIFLPFFADKTDGTVQAVSLLQLVLIAPYLKAAYCSFTAAIILCGILTLILKNFTDSLWVKNKSKISVLLTTAATLLFIISQQPYAAVFLFAFLAIKVLMLINWQ